MDDSTDKHFEFDKVLDCLERIPQLASKRKAVDIENNELSNITTENKKNNFCQIKCPKCGSTSCTPIVETKTSGKDFSVGKGCCGYSLLGPLGLLCGACGKGKQTTTTTYWMCSSCGNKFQK